MARATAFGHLATESCATIWPVHEAGTHTDDVYPYDRGHGGTALSLQLQHWPGDGPLAVGAGAGWLASDEVPFALLSVGARTRGAPALFAEVEGWVSRLRYDRVTARWSRFEVVEELERTGHSAWNRSLSVRVGAHFPLF